MWWGVLIGLLGLGVGFFGIRRASITTGRISEHDRQKRYAEMILREVTTKDAKINKTTSENVQLVRRTTRRRLKTKTGKSAKSFLSRTKHSW